MLRRVRDGKTAFSRQGFNGPWTLREEFKQFEPPRTGERFTDESELAVKTVFEFAMCDGFYSFDHNQLFNRTIE
jgi:hypothetical protein